MGSWHKNYMKRLILAVVMAITFLLVPEEIFASATDLSPSVLDVSKKFSEKFCISIENGMTSEESGETAAAQLSKSLLFSPVMNEIMSAPKQDLAGSLSKNILDKCGKDIGESNEELNDYLTKLVKKIPSKSNNNFQLPPIRQTTPK